MTTQRNKLREDVQFRILRLLQDNPEMSQRELAKAVGLSTGGIHYVLNALLDKGLLKIENSTTTEDKRRYAYILTREGMASKANLTKRFLIRKMADYDFLKAEIDEVFEDLSDTEVTELEAVFKDC
jgi:EPS-associated MarR family transcriptional regulator